MRQLDADALALFARKGLEAGPAAPQVGEANAVKVRRVMQITADLARKPFETLRLLDLGCGEGVYAIEAALRGADVLAIDARSERMEEGAAVAERHGIANVAFRLEDARGVTRETHGEFDVVYLLGLLYHLDAPDVFQLLRRVRDLCADLLVIDTLISLEGGTEVEHDGITYEGQRRREHEDADPAEVRRARLLRSVDNTFAFVPTRDSLVRALGEAGFGSVYECEAPAEPGKAPDRITLAAKGRERVAISSYPWVNRLSETEIARRLRTSE